MDYLKVKFYPMPQKSLFGDSDPLPDGAIILPNGMYALHGDNKDKGQRTFCGCIKVRILVNIILVCTVANIAMQMQVNKLPQ